MNIRKHKAIIKKKAHVLKIFIRTIKSIEKTLTLIHNNTTNNFTIDKNGYKILKDLYKLKADISTQVLQLHFDELLETKNINEINFWNIFIMDVNEKLKRAHGVSDKL